MNNTELLTSTIQSYEKSGLQNVDFLKQAHAIYNKYATFPPTLPSAENPYLLGIVFSYFAKYYENNINNYTCIVENALFCFDKVMKTSSSQSERQCAAIRMLLILEDNYRIIMGMIHVFCEKRCQELYGNPLMMHRMLAQGMDPWTYEMDVLKQLGSFCIEKSNSCEKHSFISSIDMQRFKNIENSGKYKMKWPLTMIPSENVYKLFSDFITENINTPYDRRITQLHYC